MSDAIKRQFKELDDQRQLNEELADIKKRNESIIEQFDASEAKKMPAWVLEIIQGHFLLENESAKEAGMLGFYARALAMCVTPYKDPKSYFYKRKNGDFELTILSSQGVPFGVIPRLLMSWVTTECVRTKSPVLKVGASLSNFLRNVLDMQSGGGVRGNSTRVRNQMIKLFSSHIDAAHIGKDNRSFTMKNVSFAEELNLNFDELDTYFKSKETTLWIPQREDVGAWESELILNKKFFEECVTCPVPIDLRAYKALKGSPFAMDIYTWLTYRMSYLRRESKIPWEALMLQFGANFNSSVDDITSARRNFKKQFELAMKGVIVVYPNVNVDTSHSQYLILRPSNPHIPRSVQPSLPF